MYRHLWNRLPGPTAARLGQLLVILTVILVVLFGWVFPWLSGALGLDTGTVSMIITVPMF